MVKPESSSRHSFCLNSKSWGNSIYMRRQTTGVEGCGFVFAVWCRLVNTRILHLWFRFLLSFTQPMPTPIPSKICTYFYIFSTNINMHARTQKRKNVPRGSLQTNPWIQSQRCSRLRQCRVSWRLSSAPSQALWLPNRGHGSCWHSMCICILQQQYCNE